MRQRLCRPIALGSSDSVTPSLISPLHLPSVDRFILCCEYNYARRLRRVITSCLSTLISMPSLISSRCRRCGPGHGVQTATASSDCPKHVDDGQCLTHKHGDTELQKAPGKGGGGATPRGEGRDGSDWERQGSIGVSFLYQLYLTQALPLLLKSFQLRTSPFTAEEPDL